MKCNRLMKELSECCGELSPADLTAAEKHIEKLFSDVRSENGCLFLASHNGRANPENITDKVEFEAWHNEILINREFPKRSITPAFAMRFFDLFNARLREYGERICAVMSEDDGRWTYRFHIVREGEPLWISEDLEKFSQPIMYDIFGGEYDEL